MKTSIIALLLMAIMSITAIAVVVEADNLRGENANAYIRYGDFQSQGTVRDGNVIYSWNTRTGAEVISETSSQIRFTSDGYVQVGRTRTLTVVTVIYNKASNVLTVDVPALPPIVKNVMEMN